MGQYYIFTNTTKREFIHPHTIGVGLKHMEIASSSAMMYALSLLIVQSDDLGGGDWGALWPAARRDHSIVGSWAGDNITMIGDYDSSNLYCDARDTYRDVSMDLFKAMCRDHRWNSLLKEGVKYRLDPDNGICDSAERKVYEDAFSQTSFYVHARRAAIGS